MDLWGFTAVFVIASVGLLILLVLGDFFADGDLIPLLLWMFAAVGLYLAGEGVVALDRYVLVRHSEEACPGHVAVVEGAIEPIDDPIETPFGGEPAVCCAHRAERWDEFTEGYILERSGLDCLPFDVVSDDGRFRVDPDGADLRFGPERTIEVGEDELAPRRIRTTVANDSELSSVDGPARYVESFVGPHDWAGVLGWISSVDDPEIDGRIEDGEEPLVVSYGGRGGLVAGLERRIALGALGAVGSPYAYWLALGTVGIV